MMNRAGLPSGGTLVQSTLLILALDVTNDDDLPGKPLRDVFQVEHMGMTVTASVDFVEFVQIHQDATRCSDFPTLCIDSCWDTDILGSCCRPRDWRASQMTFHDMAQNRMVDRMSKKWVGTANVLVAAAVAEAEAVVEMKFDLHDQT